MCHGPNIKYTLMNQNFCSLNILLVIRFKVWHYTSTLFYETMLEQKAESTKPQNENVAPALPELWEVAFQPALKGKYPENFTIQDKPVSGGLKPKEPVASKQAYRPPMAR